MLVLKLTVKSAPRPKSLAGGTDLCLRDTDMDESEVTSIAGLVGYV